MAVEDHAEHVVALALHPVGAPPDAGEGGTVRAAGPEPGAETEALSARFRRGLGASVAAARQLGVEKVLPKPFTRVDLELLIRSLIDRPGPAAATPPRETVSS